MKQKILLALGCLLMVSGAWATNYTLTLYANGCSSPNTFICQAGQQLSLNATPMAHRHFVKWNDGNTDNPRLVTMNQDVTYTATFALDIEGECGDNLTWRYSNGTLTISGTGDMYKFITYTTTSNTIPWNHLRDSIENVVLEHGVTSIGKNAFFNFFGLTNVTIPSSVTCIGESAFAACSGLTSVVIPNSVKSIDGYAFDGCSHLRELTIGTSVTEIGDKAFRNCKDRKFTKIVFPQSVKTIGERVCEGCEYLTSITFGSELEEIGDYAFMGCTRINDMTCYATVTPDAAEHTFDGVNTMAYLYVQAGSARTYKLDPIWGVFDIKEIGAESTMVTGNSVQVEPSNNEAVFTWPMANNADTYSLTITKDGEVFCTLTFNANGQLIGLAFAPSLDGSANAPAATTSIAGMSFTVTGLDGASKYAYRLAAKDATNEEIVAYSGEFATSGYEGEVIPGGNPEYETALDNVSAGVKAEKQIIDGVLYIIRDGVRYTATGQRAE